MKSSLAFTFVVALFALGGCASYDQQTHDDVNVVLDYAIQFMNLATQAVEMLAR
jgi:hypothetical protein